MVSSRVERTWKFIAFIDSGIFFVIEIEKGHEIQEGRINANNIFDHNFNYLQDKLFYATLLISYFELMSINP